MEADVAAHQTPSPYRPGYNRRPPLLAGRDEILALADEAVAIAAVDGGTPPALLIVGPRGVGKSVLLGEIAERAATSYGWPRLHVEVTPSVPFTPELVDGARDLLARFDQAAPGGLRVHEATVGAAVGPLHGELHLARADPTATPNGALELRRALTVAADAAMNRGGGFVLTIDEMQLTQGAELARLAAVLQHGIDLAWPVVMVGAGLAGMRDPERTVSYFERADWYEIGALTPAATLAALRVPAQNSGRPIDDDAALLLAEASGGYPYAIQLYGHHAWRASAGRSRIDKGAAQQAVQTGTVQLEHGLYANRWTHATSAERHYLGALARLVESRQSVRGAEVANELGVTTRQVAGVRDRLIKKGTITADGELLTFVVPGMANYIRTQEADSEPNRSGTALEADGSRGPSASAVPQTNEPIRWPRRMQSGPDFDLDL